MDNSFQGLTKRLDRLEREIHWWRQGGLVCLLSVLAIFLMGQGMYRSKVLEADKFVLKDGKGKVRAVLGPLGILNDADDYYGLAIYDAGGRRTIAALREGVYGSGQLELFDKSSASDVRLSSPW